MNDLLRDDEGELRLMGRGRNTAESCRERA